MSGVPNPPTDSPDPAASSASDAGRDTQHTFRISRVAYFAVPMTFVVTVILAGASLAWLGWTLVIPVLLGWWIWRLRTIVTDDGIEAVGTFGRREIGWEEIDGLQFARWGAVRAVLINDTKVRLPAITFRDLPQLSAASGGRIPDPYADLD